ncbi:hypothetical protein GGR50DRAFT_418289 [Xylaria sp. CBS 124048]|nr:hypothetical protein GGR50DRAFT_418289 [Xylaria sp. CBS 124048]
MAPGFPSLAQGVHHHGVIGLGLPGPGPAVLQVLGLESDDDMLEAWIRPVLTMRNMNTGDWSLLSIQAHRPKVGTPKEGPHAVGFSLAWEKLGRLSMVSQRRWLD